MNEMIDAVRAAVRGHMQTIAAGLTQISGGKLSPTMITITGILAHLPIAYLIAVNNYLIAAILLVIFGLFDALDGALAREQNKASNAGMLLDASTDRMKEVFLYMGVAYSLVSLRPDRAALAALTVVAACGSSIIVSYVKAKGETAIKDQNLTPNEINRLFQDGLLRFEVRMFVLIVGLIASQLFIAVAIIAVLSWYTAIVRLSTIYKKLS